MACHDHYLKFAESLEQPVADARPSQIVKRAHLNAGMILDEIELASKVAHGTFAMTDRPFALPPDLLDMIITLGRDENVGIALWLRHLLLSQQLDHLIG